MGRSWVEDIGWEEFVKVVEKLGEVSKTAFGGSEVRVELASEHRPLPGTMSVMVVASVLDEVCDYSRELLENKLGRLSRLMAQGVVFAVR